MNRIEKLLRKISKDDREELLKVVQKLLGGDIKNLNFLKLKGSDMYRVRHGKYRIIFHYEKGLKEKEIIIDSIKLRSEDTYK